MKKTFTKQFEWVMGMTGSTSCFSPTRRLLLLLCLILVGAGGAKAQSNQTYQTYDADKCYTKVLIDAKINDFVGNTKRMGFGTYNSETDVITQPQWKTDISSGSNRDLVMDYVAGLVAKACIEAADYYKDFTWSKPWFKLVENYATKVTVPTTGASLDDLNASKMYFALAELTKSGAKYANSTTYNKAISELKNAITGLTAVNNDYSICNRSTVNYYSSSRKQTCSLVNLSGESVSPNASGNMNAIGGWYHKATYPNQMWCDSEYMGPALLAQLVAYATENTSAGIGTVTGTTEGDWKLIAKQFDITWNYLWNSTDKLLYHGFSATPDAIAAHTFTWATGTNGTNEAYWGRAIGWYFLALVDVLENMPDDISDNSYIQTQNNLSSRNANIKTRLKSYLTDLAAGIWAQKKDNYLWTNVINEAVDKEHTSYSTTSAVIQSNTKNYLEASASAIYIAAYIKAMRLGLLPSSTYESGIKTAYQNYISNFIKEDNTIINTCASAGLGGGNVNISSASSDYKSGGKKYRDGTADYYTRGYDVTKVTDYQEGKPLGAFILASTEYERYLKADYAPSFTAANAEIPTAQTVTKGQFVTLHAAAMAKPLAAYQWYSYPALDTQASNAKRAATTVTAIPGATSSDLTVTPQANTYYYCEATNSAGSAQTEPVLVTVSEGGSESVGSGTEEDVIATFKNATATTWEASEKNGFSISNVTMKSGTVYVKLASKNTITITIPSGYTVTGLNINALCTSSNTNSELTFKNGETSLGTVTISSGQSLGDYNCTLSNNVKGATTITITNSGSKEININTIQVLGYSGTPSTPTGYTITYNMNGHGTQIDPASDLTALPNPLPTPSAVEGYTFGGWYTDANCTTAATPGATISESTTLYAKWTPITDLFTLTSITSTTVSVNSKATVTVTSDNATITGGSAQLYNGYSNQKDMISGNQINLNGSSASYLKITLDNTLKAGDEIIINPATSSFILKAPDSNSSDISFTGSYVIQQGDDAVVGKNVIYIYKETATGATSLIKDINITRDYPESDSRATFTYGSSQLTFTETPEGTYTTTLEIGASKKGETITITPSKQDGATIKKDGTTVSGDITITAPSTTGNTDTHTYTVTSKDGSSTTTYIINVKVVKEKITLKYSDSNGNTEWTWNSTTTPIQPTFVQPTVKAYIKNAEGKDELLTDASLSYTYESDVTSVATVDASSGKITIAKSGNGGAKIYATLKENENYYADPAFFNVLLEQGYSFSVNASETAPAINTSKYITRTTEGTEEKLVKMTFGGWKWEGYANADATTKTLGSYKVERAGTATYYTDKWNDSGEKASDIASIDGHYYSWNGVNDAVDESKAASDKAIYGSIRYGWFKSPVHDSDGKTTVSYPYTLPVRGSFMTFEPTMNGTLTIYILQNGAWNTNNNGGTYVQNGDGSITYEKGDIIPGQFRPHAFQVVNQRGLTVQEFSPNYSVSTKQKVDSRYYCMFQGDKDYNQTKYNNPYNVAKWTEFADYMSTEEQKRAHDSWNSGPLGAQKIIELDNGSFLAVQKGIVKYTFHVTGNETYYFFSNFSKMGFSGANFVPDVSQPQETVSDKISTLDLSDVKAYNKITAKENGKIEGTNLKDYTYSINGKDIAPVAGVSIPQFYSIKLTRTFTKDQWTTLTLPFNLTEEEVQRIFGAGTQLIQLNNATVDNGCAKLEFIYHEIQNVLPGHPYLIKPTLTDITNDANVTVIKDNNTITNFTVFSKCVNPFISQVDIDCDAYTFKGIKDYCTANVTSTSNTTNWSVNFKKNDIFVSDGDGKLYVSGGSSYGKGYRAWFEKKVDTTDTTSGKINSISLVIDNPGDDDDNVVTTIDMVDVDPDVFNALGIATGVYNLNGQKVSDDMRSLPKGIYIVNGKKIVRK